MSSVIAVPGVMTSAATDLATITSNLNAAHLMAAPPTLAVLPAAADEISTGVAHLFSRYAEDYQRLARKAADFQEQFAQQLTAGAGAYAGAEAANTALLQPFGDIAGSIGTVGSQLLNTVATFRGAFVTALTPVLAIVAFIAIIAIIVAAVLILQLLNGAGFTYLLGLIGL